ncbi:MAG: PAS domain S-box protein [Proteobacteria bacterium]|nr:PAS domain S-box protein [Pseudomonadota bacterium]MBU1648896.1 PAS domain S-box protein [Pseudomonadota bacterium]
MTPISASTRSLHNALRGLYQYGSHIQLAALAAVFTETTILWKILPKSLLFSGILCYVCLSSFYISVIIYARRGSTLKISKTYRLLFLISLLLALCWGSSVLLITNGTLLLYAIHTLFLFCVCALFSSYLAAIPTMAYCFLSIGLTPMLYILFFKAPDYMAPFAHSLLALTCLQGGFIYFYSRALRAATLRCLHNLRTRPRSHYPTTSQNLSALNVLNDFKEQLQKFTDQKTSHRLIRNEAIWNTILTITDQSHLQNSWQNCFSGKLSTLCQPLESDRIYIVEADKNARQAARHQKKYQATIDHSWIFNNPDCLALLKNGHAINSQSPQVSEQEQKGLKELGIQAFHDIPILLKNELWGIIGMDKLTKATPFTEQQIQGLKFIANILAMTIRNQQDCSERDRLATVIEQSSDCTLITDPAGHVLYANPACETITGYSQAEITNTHIKALYPENVTGSNAWKEITTALKNGKKWQGQFANYRKDHTLYEEEMLLSPAFNPEGGITHQVIVKRNITEKKRLEAIVEAANLMDNIGFIFSSIRHELGNPINSIKVSLSVLDSNLELYDKSDIKRFINRGLSDIGRVEYLLKTLKNFSTFERPIIEKTDMTALINKFLTLIATDLKQKNIQLTTNIPKEPCIGMIDPRAFQQVLLNLIANAADSLTETLQKNISLTMLQKENGQINIIIGDNGCGISDHEQTNLFKPFYTTKPQGTGLGLVIVKKMLSKMSCSIDIRSKNNIGTKVLIVIPGL